MDGAKWIKIVTNIFEDEKILMIETMPEGDTIIVIWFKLLALAGKQNNGGVFQMGKIPYTDEMFAVIFRRNINTVRLALSTFERYGMIEVIHETVTIPNWGKHQSLDVYEKKKERDRLYQAERRANQRALVAKSSDESSDNRPTVERQSHDESPSVAVSDKEEEREGDIEGEEDNNKPGKRAGKKPVKHKHGEFQNVLLTDAEFEKLGTDYGIPLRDQAISFFDAYIEEKGYKSKSHNLAIRRWVIDAVNSRGSQNPQPIKRTGYQKPSKADELDEFYRMAGDWANQ